MQITLAKTYGFCWGVRRAINIAEETARMDNTEVQTFGPLIHNEAELERLRQEGIVAKDTQDELQELLPVVIRAHGIAPKVQRELELRNSNVIDATCPLVKKVHGIVKLKAMRGYKILIYGEKEHPEIMGVIGYTQGNSLVVRNLEEAKKLPKLEGKLAIVGQTTEIPGEYEEVCAYLKSVYPDLEVFDTICQPTKDAKSSAVTVAKNSDLMIVIGGRASSNTIKLARLCSSICKTIHISSPDEVNNEMLKNVKNLGVTAGASTPDWLVKKTFERLEELSA